MSDRVLIRWLGCYGLLCTLFILGCQEKQQQPGFLERSYQDCQNGDVQACQMLSDLLRPQKVEKQKPTSRKPTQVQMNVKAMIGGIERARSTPIDEGPDVAPSSVPETDKPTVPVDP